jgi:hypothetical protein
MVASAEFENVHPERRNPTADVTCKSERIQKVNGKAAVHGFQPRRSLTRKGLPHGPVIKNSKS